MFDMYGDMYASSDKTHRLINIQAGCCHIDEAHRYRFRNKVEGDGYQKFANLFWTIYPKNVKTVSL